MNGWETGIPYVRWNPGDPLIRWNVSSNSLTISHLATEYVLVPLAATKSGTAYNPTADTVQFAFMPTAVQVPGVSDWVSGSWETVATNIIYPYNARCLVGPSGATALTYGNYVIYLQITDSPEIPVLTAGNLTIS
jgi:hypothetical protein